LHSLKNKYDFIDMSKPVDLNGLHEESLPESENTSLFPDLTLPGLNGFHTTAPNNYEFRPQNIDDYSPEELLFQIPPGKTLKKGTDVKSIYINFLETELVKFFKHRNGFTGNSSTEPQPLEIQTLRDILKENKAIISGGFVLKSIKLFDDPKSIDIDIYVKKEDNINLNEKLSELFKSEGTITHLASTGSSKSSFLQKNGIHSVEKYHKGKSYYYAEMDIITTINNPIEVIKTFDLTFCQVWYDGEKIYAMHPDHETSKHGFLQKNYLDLYKAGNLVTKKRMLKYIKRGFSISIEDEGVITNVTDIIESNSSLDSTVTNTPNKSAKRYITGIHGKSKLPITDADLDLVVTAIAQVRYRDLAIATRLGGSTGAYKYVKKGEPGNFWVVKGGGKDAFSSVGGGPEQVKSESLTNDIYEAAGVRVPAHRLDGDKLILEYIDGFILRNYVDKPEFNSIKEDLCKHFVIDLLVSNYDVIGAEYDNVMIPSDGSKAVRIDNGAGLTFRAMGRFKTEFSGNVGKELDPTGLYRYRTISPTPLQDIFNGLTDQQIAKQILEQFTPEKIEKILSVIPEELPGLPTSDPPLMKDIIRERIEYMIIWANEPGHTPTNGGKRKTKKKQRRYARSELSGSISRR